MEIIKETKYLLFKDTLKQGRKTKIISIVNKSSLEEIATIEWYGPWRQYCFMPEPFFRTVWNPDCLAAVNEVIADLMNQRRIKKIGKPVEYKIDSKPDIIE